MTDQLQLFQLSEQGAKPESEEALVHIPASANVIESSKEEPELRGPQASYSRHPQLSDPSR